MTTDAQVGKRTSPRVATAERPAAWRRTLLIERVHVLGVVGVMALAIGLRLWGIQFGLPYLYHIDEPNFIVTAARLGRGTLHSRPYDPAGFANILFVEFSALFAIGRVLGVLDSTTEFIDFYTHNRAPFYLLGRIMSALLGALTVWLVYRIGRRLQDRTTGLLAALFLAVTFMHVRESHFSTPDVAMTTLVTLAAFLAIGGRTPPGARRLLLAGLAGGAAVAMKWLALPVAVLVLVAAWLPGHGRRRWRLGLSVAGLLSGFAILSFQTLLDPARYGTKLLLDIERARSVAVEGWYVDTVPAPQFYVQSLANGLGWPLLLLGVAGLAWQLARALQRRDRDRALVGGFAVGFFVCISFVDFYFARYTLLLVPLLALAAADFLSHFVVGPDRDISRTRLAAIALITLVAILPPLLSTTRYNMLLRHTDTRTLALAWIEGNIPAGARIGVDWSVYAPPLDNGGLVVPWVPASDTHYDVIAAQYDFLDTRALESYREAAFDYLITSSFIYNLQSVDPTVDGRRRAFHARLDTEAELVMEFSPYDGAEPPWVFEETNGPVANLWQRQRPGPILKIYRLR